MEGNVSRDMKEGGHRVCVRSLLEACGFVREDVERPLIGIANSFTDAIAKGLAWVQEHTAAEVAKVIQPSFPDTDLKTLETVVQNYKDIDAWRAEPDMKEESFQKLQTVMQEAGELEKTAPFSELVNNSFAEKTKK